MKTSTYNVNKGINTPVTFRGLKAQYIGYLGGGLVLLLIVFALLYIAGLNPFLCVLITFICAGWLFIYTARLSKKYGVHGLRKKLAKKKMPSVVISRSRRVFTKSLKRYKDLK